MHNASLSRACCLVLTLTACAQLPDPPVPGVRSEATVSCPSQHPQYYPNAGIISPANIVVIKWGTNVRYSDQIAPFYQAMLGGPYFAWLTEYNAPGFPIVPGQVTEYTDSDAPSGDSIDQTEIEAELARLVSNGLVPYTWQKTLLAVHMPKNVRITRGSSQSCRDFCGFHDFVNASTFIAYTLIPDNACLGCNAPPDQHTLIDGSSFPAFTMISSHELVEAVTDTGGETWLDADCGNFGELGDICEEESAPVDSVSGYTVAKIWSNNRNRCQAEDPFDFSLTWPSQHEAIVQYGQPPTVFPIQTADSGLPVQIFFSAPIVPRGLTVSFDPPAIISGQSTNMLVTAGIAGLNGAFPITVRAYSPTVGVFNPPGDHETIRTALVRPAP